jgi:hypothetical protein
MSRLEHRKHTLKKHKMLLKPPCIITSRRYIKYVINTSILHISLIISYNNILLLITSVYVL